MRIKGAYKQLITEQEKRRKRKAKQTPMSATAQPQSNWTADPQSVLELATLLKNSMSPDHVTRTTAMDSLRLFNSSPNF